MERVSNGRVAILMLIVVAVLLFVPADQDPQSAYQLSSAWQLCSEFALL